MLCCVCPLFCIYLFVSLLSVRWDLPICSRSADRGARCSICIHVYIYIYIYIERERDKRKRHLALEHSPPSPNPSQMRSNHVCIERYNHIHTWYVNMCIYECIHTCLYMLMFMYISLSIYIYICIKYVYVYVYIYIYIHTYIQHMYHTVPCYEHVNSYKSTRFPPRI